MIRGCSHCLTENCPGLLHEKREVMLGLKITLYPKHTPNNHFNVITNFGFKKNLPAWSWRHFCLFASSLVLNFFILTSSVLKSVFHFSSLIFFFFSLPCLLFSKMSSISSPFSSFLSDSDLSLPHFSSLFVYFIFNKKFTSCLHPVSLLLGTFRFEYEYEIEYEDEFLISNQSSPLNPNSSLLLTSRSGDCRNKIDVTSDHLHCKACDQDLKSYLYSISYLYSNLKVPIIYHNVEVSVWCTLYMYIVHATLGNAHFLGTMHFEMHVSYMHLMCVFIHCCYSFPCM